MGKKAILVVFGVLCILGGFWGMRFVFLGPAVEVVRPVWGPAVLGVYAPGHVEPERMIPISSRISGKIKAFYKEEGDEVDKGETLFALEDEELQSALKQTEAKEALMEVTYGRLKALRAGSVVSQSALDEALANWETAKAAVGAARAQLALAKITSDQPGRVIQRDGEVGQTVSPSQVVFWVSCCGQYRVIADVDEEEVPALIPGLPVVIRADAFPGQIFKGKVLSITPKGDQTTRSFRVKIDLEPGAPLLIGMTVEVNIILKETKRALLVPAEAVQDRFVWMVSEGRLVKRAVEVGILGEEKVEILKGIEEGDVIVRTAERGFLEGQRVRSVFKEGAAR